MEAQTILIDWRDVNAKDGCRWDWTLALYAVLHPREDVVLYLGKADGTSVRARWDADDKHERVWRRMEDGLGIFEHCFIVGEICLPIGMRLTRQFVADVESLLIYQLKPRCNTQCVKSRDIYRPGMVVCCQVSGPWSAKHFAIER